MVGEILMVDLCVTIFGTVFDSNLKYGEIF